MNVKRTTATTAIAALGTARLTTATAGADNSGNRDCPAGDISGGGLFMRCRVKLRGFARLFVLAGVTAATVGLSLPATSIAADPDYGVVPGAVPSPGVASVPTWHDTFTDPTNGLSYGVDLVGSEDPRTPGAGTTTIQTEIVPVDLTFEANGGQQFNGSDATDALINSPMFQPTDFSVFSNNVGVQAEDSVMRSQFNQVGGSPFHFLLTPTVLPTLQLDVRANHGQVEDYPANGAQFGCYDWQWFLARMWNYIGAMHIRPTTLPIFLFKWSRGGVEQDGTCIPQFVGLHGGGNPARGPGFFISETVGQTWIIGSYEPAAIRPITPTHPYTFRNIEVFGHEISEWADDPYGTNAVQPLLNPNPANGGTCLNGLETGDPADWYTTSLPGNTYFQNVRPTPGLPGNDGTWTLQDEAFLPWFSRESPNVTSEPEASSGFGRYTWFGDLNPNPAFHAPAQHC